MSRVERTKHIDSSRFAADASRFTVAEAASFIEGRAVALAPTNKHGGGGTLRSSIRKDVQSATYAEVVADAEYAVYVEFGTGPHPINSPVLIDGNWRYIGMHPGTRPQQFMRPALDELRSRLGRVWRDSTGRAYGGR